MFSLLTRTFVDEYDVDDEDERNNNKCMKEEKKMLFAYLPTYLTNWFHFVNTTIIQSLKEKRSSQSSKINIIIAKKAEIPSSTV